VIGSRVIVQSNASVGQDGFGFSTHNGEHHKIPQIGRVILEDDAEIGANASIERGALDDTVIGKGTKVGDQVAIGHGTTLGAHCLLVPQVGISGSTEIGHHCVFGGQVGIVGHIKIGDMVRVGAQSGVMSDLESGKTYLGSPAMEASKAKRAMVMVPFLPEMKKKIKALEKKVKKLLADKS
jgi:UDP-3-O-[3-hydroxymyristoyl] glucosamine N-acyltransferase